MSFKGGTSLSKCWHLIDRFSEDIDIAIDREYLGFYGTLSKTQISDKLRRATCSFVRKTMQHDLAEQLCKNGIAEDKFQVNVDITPISTTDPETININYDSVLTLSIDGENGLYVLPKIKVEVSGRSMSEPMSEVSLDSMIDQVYPKAPFAEPKFNVRAVLPERTFLEKIFLLHEEFAKPKDLIRVERMSRHMYDIGQMLKTPIAEKAIHDEQLYAQIVEHRRTFVGLHGFDYDTLYPATLNIIPPYSIIDQWEADYENMRLHMIYGESVSFEKLVNNLKELNDKIGRLHTNFTKN
ncbi:nucleotidyl transferase AbiEii/AbiGii toxin family protein [Bacteroides pyogenes]|uniref:nucleotidyl transferase AbiEii/AbiGii toxin family protein n=1 Tax=Bacteroides pyogenes TaxID=310300 RepID=UPI00292A3C19|nr:nucleotidyl transferase AbiEii/AbiGii toxin family protein [Bacteroides pyogenes]MDY5432734.1 nucleotidyl transferase AbiEii/AbiGii toxin family protein [Bacteroides pyogenes]